MKHALKIIVGFTAGLTTLIAIGATNEIAASGGACTTIANHDINLKALTSAPSTTVLTGATPQITLTGIMSIFGPPQVLFKSSTLDQNGKLSEGNASILNEGQSQNGIKVLHIDTQARVVTFNNHGVFQEISLANTSGTSTQVPTAPSVAKIDLHPADFERSRTPEYLGGGSDPSSADQPFRNKTLDERIIMIEAQRAYYKSQNDPRADQLPPTAMTPPDETTSAN